MRPASSGWRWSRARPGPATTAWPTKAWPCADLAAIIGRHLHLPLVSKSPAEAADHFGWMARFVALDMPASSARTQQELSWYPTHPGLLADLEQGSYFKA